MQKDQIPIEKVMPLTFGAIISLSPTNEEHSFVVVNGFVKEQFLVKRLEHGGDSKVNYSQCLFQIYPAFINTHKRQALIIEKDFSRTQMQNHDRIEMINNLQNKVITEFNYNLDSFQKAAGQPVLFGQSVQLLHVASNKFLKFTVEEADIEKENYKLELDEFSNEATIMKFLPCYKHQKESEGIIYLDESIYIATPNAIFNKITYLHLSNPTTVKLRNYEDEIKNDSPRKVPTLPPIRSQQVPDTETTKLRSKIEVNGSIESQSRFRINFFNDYHSEAELNLEFGDIIWLNNSELDSPLVSFVDFGNKLQNYKVEFDVSNKVTNKLKQFSGNTNGMWRIEHNNYQRGGPVQWNQEYRLRHLSSGLYLSVQSVQKKTEKQISMKVTLDKNPKEDNLFMFVPLITGQKNENSATKNQIMRENFALLMHKTSGFIIQAGYNRESSSNRTGENNQLFSSKVDPVLSRYGVGSEEAAIKIIKSNYNEVWETNFLIACFPLLTKFIDTITNIKFVTFYCGNATNHE